YRGVDGAGSGGQVDIARQGPQDVSEEGRRPGEAARSRGLVPARIRQGSAERRGQSHVLMKRLGGKYVVAGLALVLTCAVATVRAQGNIDFAKLEIQTVKITDGVYVLMGGPAQG